MHAILDLPAPKCAATNFVTTAIPLDNKQIAWLKSKAQQFFVGQFEMLDSQKVKAVTQYIAHTEVREGIALRRPIGLLLDSTLNLSHLTYRRPTPAARKCGQQ